MSISREERLGLTMCSYDRHYFTDKKRTDDFDYCAHPWCQRAVMLHYRSKTEQFQKELERVKKVHEDTVSRIIDRVASLPV